MWARCVARTHKICSMIVFIYNATQYSGKWNQIWIYIIYTSPCHFVCRAKICMRTRQTSSSSFGIYATHTNTVCATHEPMKPIFNNLFSSYGYFLKCVAYVCMSVFIRFIKIQKTIYIFSEMIKWLKSNEFNKMRLIKLLFSLIALIPFSNSKKRQKRNIHFGLNF